MAVQILRLINGNIFNILTLAASRPSFRNGFELSQNRIPAASKQAWRRLKQRNFMGKNLKISP